ncbi:MAG TPA: tetratricopeptide repeat protein [Rhizomicrobium sp.]|nr:tetratricopeptide repeat protein [Rhizomicrobium sp.]
MLGNYDQAIRLMPGNAEAHVNKGNALRSLGRAAEAIESFDQAIALRPDLAEAHYNRGNALTDLKRYDDARASYERAIALRPNFPEAHFNCGNVLQLLGRQNDAIASYDRALMYNTNFAEAQNNRAEAFRILGRPDEALDACAHALELNPGLADAHFNKGNVLQDLKRYEDAAASYECALGLRPDFVDAYSNRGNALRALGRPDESLQSCEMALALDSRLPEAHNNKGYALHQLKRTAEALRSYDEALALRSGYADALWNKSVCLLLAGRFGEGWPLYEWRKKSTGPVGIRSFPQPEWLGREPLAGKTLLVHAEQGLGDTIQFCRCVTLARAQGAKVIFAVQPVLTRLLRDFEPGVEIVRLDSDFPSFDYHAPLLSLPLAFRTDETNIPCRVPYLRAEADRIRAWGERLGKSGFKIGICGQGSGRADVDLGRSFPLRCFEGLAQVPDVRLIRLQKHNGGKQLSDSPAAMKVEDPGPGFDAGPDAFVDTAAIMENLDLVITSDTAIAHLAGALARPVWVALQYVPDWRWLLDRSDSPWYPTMRLFRQTRRGDWTGVFAGMETALRGL